MGTTQLAWPCTSNKQFKAKRIYRMHFSSTILKHLVKLFSNIRNAFLLQNETYMAGYSKLSFYSCHALNIPKLKQMILF